MPAIDRTLNGHRFHFKGKMLTILIASAFAISLITTSLIVAPSSENNPPASNAPSRISYSSHAQIYINGNTGFINASGVSWGSGTALDPYIIENWDIDASIGTWSAGIIIANTNAYFIVRNCYVHDGTMHSKFNNGIWLSNCLNGNLSSNLFLRNRIDVNLDSSNNNTLINNTLARYTGIRLYTSNNNTLINNTFDSGGSDDDLVYIAYSTSNIFINNTFKSGWRGMYLETCSNTQICNNSYLNNEYGMYLHNSNDSIISGNQFCNNVGYGIWIGSGSSNRIWNNTFIGNHGAGSDYDPSHIQAYDNGMNNSWNTSGTPHGYGNNWSDWRAPDNNWDGIVDNPYNLSGSAAARDYYPLTIPGTPVIPEPSILLLVGIMTAVFLTISRTRKKP